MEEIFRFVHLRAPQTPAGPGPAGIQLVQTDFVRRLISLRQSDENDEQIQSLLDAFFASNNFIRNTSEFSGAESLLRLLELLSQREPMSRGDLRDFLQTETGRSIIEIAADPQLDDLAGRASEAVLALKLRSRGQPPVMEHLVNILRIIDAVRRIATGEDVEVIDTAALLRRAIVYPDNALPALQQSFVPPLIESLPQQTSRVEITAEIGGLRRARAELLAFRSDDLSMIEADDANSSARTVLSAEALMRLSNETAALLANEALNPGRDDLRKLVNRLTDRMHARSATLASLPDTSPRRITVGTTTLPVNTALPSQPSFDLDISVVEGPKIPTTVGLVRPASVGDLLVTRQTTLRYVADQIGFIQNVMQSEKYLRDTRRLERTTENVTTERVVAREEERALSAAEQFATSRQANETIKDDEKFKRGFTISGGYGKFIQTKTSLSKDSATAKQNAAQSAAKWARNLTERVNTKITERIREERTLITLREFEEKIEHSFDNSDGDGHVVGVYQFVDQVKLTQVYNYGIRMFFSIMVPEPAAFFLQALASQEQLGNGIPVPKSFDLRPDEIDDINYLELASTYGATGIEPPPPEYLTQSITIVPESEDHPITIRESGEIPLPDGYFSTDYRIRLTYYSRHTAPSLISQSPPQLMLAISNKTRVILPSETAATNNPQDILAPLLYSQGAAIKDETGAVPFTLLLHECRNPTILIQIDCKRLSGHLEKWQINTFEKLRAASAAQHADYRNRLAEQAAGLGAGVPERAPFENRLIERGELKRNVISIITGQYFTMFGAILQSGGQEARVNFEKALAEGDYALFFQKAFEWENMTYEFFDYFWARRSTWVSKLLETKDIDPDFQAFLAAGYVNVLLPVTPNFEEAVLHYLETQEIWDGGELPPVTKAEYIPFLAEIAERRALEPDEEIPEGEPFEVRTPTKLVALREAPGLPVWILDEDGNVVSVETEPVPLPTPTDEDDP